VSGVFLRQRVNVAGDPGGVEVGGGTGRVIYRDIHRLPDNGRHAGCHRRLSVAHDGSMLRASGFEQGCAPAAAFEKSIFSLTEVYNYLT
jgi:hypothetical protein